jgi:hypothetical protein
MLLARGIVPLVFAADLLRSLFIPRLFLPALVAHHALIGRRRRVARHSRLPRHACRRGLADPLNRFLSALTISC